MLKRNPYKYLLWFLSNLMVALISASFAYAQEVPLTIVGPDGMGRKNEIITASIPFAKGALNTVDTIAVLDRNRQAVPAQFRVLSRWWPDSRDIRWVQAIFQADTFGNGDSFFLTRDISNPVPENPVQVSDSQDAYILENGILKVRILKTGTGLFQKIWVDKNQDGLFSAEEQTINQTLGDGFLVKQARYENVETTHTVPGEKTAVIMEESGPVRAVINIQGHHESGSDSAFLKYQIRIFMYAGRGDIKVEHTLLNSCAPEQTPQSVFWDGYDYHLGLNHSQPLEFRTKVDNTNIQIPMDTNDFVHIYQDSPGGEHWNKPLYKRDLQEAYSFRGVEVQNNDLPVQSGDQSSGWLDLVDENFGITMGMPYFWAEAPKGFTVAGNGQVTLELWPDRFSGEHEMTPDVQKTHEFYLSFHTGSEFIAQDHMAGLWHPLLALPSNEWIENSGTWEEFSAIPARNISEYSFDDFLKKNAEQGALGVWNFGANVWEHNSGVFEPPTRYYQNFILSRDYDRFKIARLNARHWRDLRSYHFGVDWENLVLNSSMQDVHNFYKKRVKHKAKGRWPVMGVEHTTAKDRVLDYYLTGSRLAAEGLAEEAEWIKWYEGKKEDFVQGLKEHGYNGMIDTSFWQEKKSGRSVGWWAGRTLGWQMRQSMMIYRALGDEDNLNFAKYLAYSRAMRNQDLVVGIYNGETKGETKPWMEAIIGVGLAHVYQTTREEDILDSLIGLGNFLSDERLVGGGGAPYVWNFGTIHTGGPSNSSNRIPGFLAWLYTQTGQVRFLNSSIAQAQGWNPDADAPKGGLGFELYVKVSENDFQKSADISPPVEITDLQTEYLGENRYRLSWTAPGINGNENRAYAYQIKYADRNIVEQVQQDWDELQEWDGTSFLSHPEISFWAAKNISGEPVPGEPGQKEVFEIEMPSAGPYHFAIKAWDRSLQPDTGNAGDDDSTREYETFVLSSTSPDLVIPPGSQARIYGTTYPSQITLAKGSEAELINFPGENMIVIESYSDLFTISRSGSVVTFQGSDGTVLKIPATASEQTIYFEEDQKILLLRIHENQVMLGEELIQTQSIKWLKIGSMV